MSGNDMSPMFYLPPQYPPGSEKARQDAMVAGIVVMTLIGMACVTLRVYTRVFIVRNMGMEDWTMIAAATLTIVFMIELLVSARKFGTGFSVFSLSPSQLVSNVKLGLAVIVVYKAIVTLIKISILMVYLRLAANKTFERLCKGSIYLLATYQFIILIVVPAQCTPLSKLWDFSGTVQGHCINSTAFYYVTTVFHIIMDIWILALPYKIIMAIPRPTRERIAVYCVFGLGIFSTICAIVRFHYLVVVTHSKDPTYDSVYINVWSVIEINVGIITASVPTLRPLFSKAQRHRTREALNQTQTQKGSFMRTSLKTGPFTQAKEIAVSIYSYSIRSGKTFSIRSGKTSPTITEPEYELDDRPPPVPPKEWKIDARIPSPIPPKPFKLDTKIPSSDMSYGKV